MRFIRVVTLLLCCLLLGCADMDNLGVHTSTTVAQASEGFGAEAMMDWFFHQQPPPQEQLLQAPSIRPRVPVNIKDILIDVQRPDREICWIGDVDSDGFPDYRATQTDEAYPVCQPNPPEEWEGTPIPTLRAHLYPGQTDPCWVRSNRCAFQSYVTILVTEEHRSAYERREILIDIIDDTYLERRRILKRRIATEPALLSLRRRDVCHQHPTGFVLHVREGERIFTDPAAYVGLIVYVGGVRLDGSWEILPGPLATFPGQAGLHFVPDSDHCPSKRTVGTCTPERVLPPHPECVGSSWGAWCVDDSEDRYGATCQPCSPDISDWDDPDNPGEVVDAGCTAERERCVPIARDDRYEGGFTYPQYGCVPRPEVRHYVETPADL